MAVGEVNYQYLYGAIVLGILVVLGVIWITGIKGNVNTGDLLVSEQSFSRIIGESRVFGAVKYIGLDLPGGVDEICVAPSMEDGVFPEDVLKSVDAEEYPLIFKSMESDVAKNVFYLKDKEIIHSFYVDRLQVQDDFYCLAQEDLNSVVLTGTGAVTVLGVKDSQPPDPEASQVTGETADEVKTYYIKASYDGFVPQFLFLTAGDRVRIVVESQDEPHGIAIPDLGLWSEDEVEFTVPKTDDLAFFCALNCEREGGQEVLALRGLIHVQ